MALGCPRCRTLNPDVARFCRRCGLSLQAPDGRAATAGRLPHPDPLKPPGAAFPIQDSRDLFFCCEVVGGGKQLLGTEPVVITVFNGGYGLTSVALRVRGLGEDGQPLFAIVRDIETLLRGQSVELEIPSYELPGPVQSLHVDFLRAEFGPEDPYLRPENGRAPCPPD
jgi:hypothetical protein